MKNLINEKKYFICPWCLPEKKKICEIHGVGITSFPPGQHIVEKIENKKNFVIDNLHECFKYYETDKYFSNEKHPNYYVPIYKNIFKKFEKKDLVNILEIGVGRGSSLKAYSSLFKKSNIVGIDINEECINVCKDYNNIHIVLGDVSNPKIREQIPFKTFDIIIDDGSHLPDDMIKGFNNLFDYISPLGNYIIEDLTCCRNPAYLISHPYTVSRYKSSNTEKKLLEFLDGLIEREDILSVNRDTDGIVVITKK
jgi:23S rRNA U2552 (ribose-2'-O)-methylase RlmE/FtsJ